MLKTKSKMTAASNESFLEHIYAEKTIFEIPFFQRNYKWKDNQTDRLINDLQSVLDEEKEVHFLGAIIFHQRPNEPGKPQIFEVIDGQQRLTTIFLLICAVVRWMVIKKHFARAVEIFLAYLVIERLTTPNSKLHSSKDDRGQINKIFEIILTNAEFKLALGSFKYVPLSAPTESTDSGTLRKNFNRFVKFLHNATDVHEDEEQKLQVVESLLQALMGAFSVVQLNVVDKSNGPVIFDSLNAAQEPMTIGDLVKNGIFAKVSNFDADTLTGIHDHLWEPFAKGFDTPKAFADFFFPYGLIHNPNTKKNLTYNELTKSWLGKTPEEIIGDMRSYQPFYNAAYSGLLSGIVDKDMKKQIKSLFDASIPQSSLPFIINVLKCQHEGGLEASAACQILHNLECFFVRRSICGHEPSGLHAVFKRLWGDLDKRTAGEVIRRIRSLPTVKVPEDNEVREHVRKTQMYKKGIAHFFISEYDKSLGGEIPSDQFQLEHVLPQKRFSKN